MILFIKKVFIISPIAQCLSFKSTFHILNSLKQRNSIMHYETPYMEAYGALFNGLRDTL